MDQNQRGSFLQGGDSAHGVHQAFALKKAHGQRPALPRRPCSFQAFHQAKYQGFQDGAHHRAFHQLPDLPGLKDRPVLHGLLHHLPGAAVLILQLLMDLLIPQDCLILFKPGGYRL